METCRVLFICLGNICRSPTAQAICEKQILERKLNKNIIVDSCGTGSWHVGESPDTRAIVAGKNRGYILDHLRARQLAPGDFDSFDYLIAMDRENLRDIKMLLPNKFSGKLALCTSFIKNSYVVDVPDPYYGGDNGFDEVINILELACLGLLEEISHEN